MKIRSILAELEVVDCRAATEFALNQEVVCITAVDLAARASEARVTPLGVRELVLCRPGDFGGPWTPPGTVSLVLYHAAIPDDAVHASTSCIVAATSLPISKAFERFDRIPQQVVAIDAMKGRLFDTFQHTHNIRQFVQRAYNVLGLPTIVVNTDGRILAHVGEFSDAREDIAAQLKTGYIAPEVQAVIDRDCIVENARATTSRTTRTGSRASSTTSAWNSVGLTSTSPREPLPATTWSLSTMRVPWRASSSTA